ncbi:MAG: hypothetical protein E7399_07460 [Ruminococcaceae bacterium]|nr:hypothetical protein [Oscillospiraceae bacterium]
MKFMQTLNPADHDYTELLAQKAAHWIYLSEKKQKKESLFGKYLLKGTITLLAVILSITFPFLPVWNVSIVITLAAILFL